MIRILIILGLIYLFVIWRRNQREKAIRADERRRMGLDPNKEIEDADFTELKD